jgi:uncharacterized protein (DUF111 family)
MKLILDPSGGIAGDMFAAALISAGADKSIMIEAMTLAANKIGEAKIWSELTHDNATRLMMDMNHNHGHLGASKARSLLTDLLNILKIELAYQEFAIDVLEILIAAEKQAHSENTFLTDHHQHHHHHHSHDHHHEEAWLHEAQDILIDIIGAALGLQLLQAPTKAILAKPVSLGGGRIKFSHGEMAAPAPATAIITRKNNIPVAMGPVDVELCTPTGSAILAALKANQLVENINIDNIICEGFSRGGKDLPIPPLKLILY